MNTSLKFERAKWIWHTSSGSADEYGEFYTELDYKGGALKLLISADTHYAAYLNGELCAFGQYSDYPYDKVYDEIDITGYARAGKNSLAVVVWYYGIDWAQTYYLGPAGLLFEVFEDGESIAHSDAHVLSRMSRAYKNHYEKVITPQLGFSFLYDITSEDGWMLGSLSGFGESTLCTQTPPMRRRPIEKLLLLPEKVTTVVKEVTPCDIIRGLDVNTVGFLKIECESDDEQMLTVSYGEHLADGNVRRITPWRDFSVEIKLKKGTNVYMNPFRRLGCMYLETVAELSPIKKARISIVPAEYPLREMPYPSGITPAEREIYDICVRTLKNCMHEHYEDCSWREQALYCMDSRNQMLCGYYAFGEYAFPRASLMLFARDARPDGLLSICAPSSRNLVIPSFSLHYFTQCAEYMEYSGDVDFIREIYLKLVSIIDTFTSRICSECGLVPPFPNEEHWNFYEWRDALDGDGKYDRSEPDLILNTLLSLALGCMSRMSTAVGEADIYSPMREKLNRAIFARFYDADEALFLNVTSTRTRSVLGNALAVLSGACPVALADALMERLWTDPAFTPVSVSMQCFFFDAALSVSREKYAPMILERIEQIYRPMVELGAGTVWETEIGQSDFGNAGSLCHGWSALPVYYYHILKS